jgi:hypothetical protein
LIDSWLYESEEEAARRKEVLGHIDPVTHWFRGFSHYLFEEKHVSVMFTLNMEIGYHFMHWWMLYGKKVFILLAV